jgi:hypothetical protein
MQTTARTRNADTRRRRLRAHARRRLRLALAAARARDCILRGGQVVLASCAVVCMAADEHPNLFCAISGAVVRAAMGRCEADGRLLMRRKRRARGAAAFAWASSGLSLPPWV